MNRRVGDVFTVRVCALQTSALPLTSFLLFSLSCARSEETRNARGWTFTAGVDDAESECGLDMYQPWDFMINNEPELEVVCYIVAPFLTRGSTRPKRMLRWPTWHEWL